MVEAISGIAALSAVGSWPVNRSAPAGDPSPLAGREQADRWLRPGSLVPLPPLPPLSRLVPLPPVTPALQELNVGGEEATQALAARLTQVAPQIQGVRVTFQPGNIIRISGSYKLGIKIPFTLTGLMGLTPDGKAAVRITELSPINAAKGLLLNELRGHQGDGLEVRGDLMVLDPQTLAAGQVPGILRQLFTSPDGRLHMLFG